MDCGFNKWFTQMMYGGKYSNCFWRDILREAKPALKEAYLKQIGDQDEK